MTRTVKITFSDKERKDLETTASVLLELENLYDTGMTTMKSLQLHWAYSIIADLINDEQKGEAL